MNLPPQIRINLFIGSIKNAPNVRDLAERYSLYPDYFSVWEKDGMIFGTYEFSGSPESIVALLSNEDIVSKMI